MWEASVRFVLPAIGLDADVAQQMVTEGVKKGALARAIGPAEQLAQKTQPRGLPGGARTWWARLDQRGFPVERSHPRGNAGGTLGWVAAHALVLPG